MSSASLRRGRWGIFLLIVLWLQSCHGFIRLVGRPNNHGSTDCDVARLMPCKHQSSESTSRLFSSKEPTDPFAAGYNDECFGLIIVAGTVGLNDAAFASSFLLLSSTAALFTSLDRLPANPQVPAAVAGFTLVLTPLVRLLLDVSQLPIDLPRVDEAPLVELALCTFSMVYGFLVRNNK